MMEHVKHVVFVFLIKIAINTIGQHKWFFPQHKSSNLSHLRSRVILNRNSQFTRLL